MTTDSQASSVPEGSTMEPAIMINGAFAASDMRDIFSAVGIEATDMQGFAVLAAMDAIKKGLPIEHNPFVRALNQRIVNAKD